MSTPTRSNSPDLPDLDAFADLVGQQLDGVISPADHARIDTALAASAQHRAVYRELVALEAQIAWEQRWPVEAPAPVIAEARPLPAVRKRRWTVPVALAAAVLLAAAAVTLYVVSIGGPTEPIRDTGPDSPGGPVADLLETSEDATLLANDQILTPGTSVAAGALLLDRGEAQFRITNGVDVTLRGATALRIHDPMHTTLTRGTAEFVVPDGATGFTVALPDGSRIVDLGTAFRVDVDEAGHATVRVTDGRVAWSPGDDSAPAVTITQGRTARLVDGVPTLDVITEHTAAITQSQTPPPIDGLDIANLGEATGRDKWWADSEAAAGAPKGQSFRTGARPGLLRAITLRTDRASMPTKTFALRVGTVDGRTFTTVATAAATQDTPWADNDYVTWTLRPAVELRADTAYAFDVDMTESTVAWQTGIPYLTYTGDAYPDGLRFNAGPDGGALAAQPTTDLVFHLDIVEAGEADGLPLRGRAQPE